MWLRLFRFGVAAYTKSTTKSWLITSVVTVLYRLVSKSVGRHEVIDVSSIKPGEMVIIEHLPITHKQQIKDEKRRRRKRRRRRSAASEASSS